MVEVSDRRLAQLPASKMSEGELQREVARLREGLNTIASPKLPNAYPDDEFCLGYQKGLETQSKAADDVLEGRKPSRVTLI